MGIDVTQIVNLRHSMRIKLYICSKFPVMWYVWGMVCAGCMRHSLAETQYNIKTMCVYCSFCLGVFLGNVVDWLVKDLCYIYCNAITDSVSLYCNGTCVTEDDDDCWWLGELLHSWWTYEHHRFIFNDLINIVNFLWKYGQLDENLWWSDTA